MKATRDTRGCTGCSRRWAVPGGQQSAHRGGSFSSGHRGEADALLTAGGALDDVGVRLLIQPGVPDLAASRPVKLADGLLGERQEGILVVDAGQGVTVPAHLLLVAVPERWLPENERTDPLRPDLHPLDAVRGHGALHQGVLPQDAEPLR